MLNSKKYTRIYVHCGAAGLLKHTAKNLISNICSQFKTNFKTKRGEVCPNEKNRKIHLSKG